MEIQKRCRQYLKHLDSHKYASKLYQSKRLAIQHLLMAKTPSDVIRILSVKSGNLKPGNYSQVLRRSRTSWFVFLLKGFLVFITFPLSLPILTLWSWFTRGTPNFLKTDGSILVDHLIALYEKSSKMTFAQECATDTHKSNSQPASRKKPQKKIVIPSSKDFVSSPTASIPSTNEPTTLKPTMTRPDITKPKPAMTSTDNTKPKPAMTSPDTTKPKPAQPFFQPTMPPQGMPPKPNNTQKPGKNPMMTSTEKPQPPAGDYGEEAMLGTIQSFCRLFTENKAALFEASIDKYTGDPIIEATRIRPCDEHSFFFDVCCSFKWSNAAPKACTIKVITEFNPPFLHMSSRSNSNEQRPKSPPKKEASFSLSSFYQQACSLFQPPPKPTFASLMKEGNTLNNGLTTREEFYEQAMGIAANDLEKVLALEAMINLLDEHIQHIKKDVYPDIVIKSSEFQQLPQEEQTRMLRSNAIDEQRIKILEDKISVWLDRLPAHYRIITPSVKAIQDEFNRIFTHIQNNEIIDAWIIYSNMPTQFSYFMNITFPHLQALEYQVRAIFHIIYPGRGRFIHTCDKSLLDEELDAHVLSLYADKEEIWCATINQHGEIDRFIIDKNSLDNEGNNILYLLQTRYPLEPHHERLIYRNVASRGYYRCTSDLCCGPSIIGAHMLFTKATEYLEQYRLSLLINPHRAPDNTPIFSNSPEGINAHFAKLAESFQNKTIGPLKTMLDAGKKVNQSTPEEERSSIAHAEYARNRRQRLAGEESPAKYLTHEQWEALLNDTTSEHQATLFI